MGKIMSFSDYRDIALNGTQKLAIYTALKAGMKLTPKTANYIGNTTEGTRIIRDIRSSRLTSDDGYIVCNKRTLTTGKNYHEYWLEKLENYVEN